jgi:hypothetical protein
MNTVKTGFLDVIPYYKKGSDKFNMAAHDSAQCYCNTSPAGTPSNASFTYDHLALTEDLFKIFNA